LNIINPHLVPDTLRLGVKTDHRAVLEILQKGSGILAGIAEGGRV
jgi:hypothetical protein